MFAPLTAIHTHGPDLIILLDNMNVRFGNRIFCQIAGIPMRTIYKYPLIWFDLPLFVIMLQTNWQQSHGNGKYLDGPY